MIARYNLKIKQLSEAGSPDALYDYMARAAPFLKEYEGSKNKKDIFDDYLFVVENEGHGKIETVVANNNECKNCKSETLIHDENTSDQICTTCGHVDYKLCLERGYMEDQETTDGNIHIYSYKRENHFNEWLLQFQAKEMTNVPNTVFDHLREEFRRQKISKESLTHSKIRECLKKLKLNKYYEHVPYILSIFKNVRPPSMNTELEEKLRNMFNKIQKPFDDNCPTERKNFLSYSYILYKFCELLSEDDFLKCFPLLKSKEKLYKQDQIWKLICKDLQWEFIPTSGV
jgi:hypothetical protein